MKNRKKIPRQNHLLTKAEKVDADTPRTREDDDASKRREDQPEKREDQPGNCSRLRLQDSPELGRTLSVGHDVSHKKTDQRSTHLHRDGLHVVADEVAQQQQQQQQQQLPSIAMVSML